MQRHRITLLPSAAIALVSLVALQPGSVRAASSTSSDVTAIIAELTKTSAELEQLETELPKKLKESLALKASYEAEAAPIMIQVEQLEASDGAAIETEKPAVESLCNQTVPPGQLSAAQAQCTMKRRALNEKINGYNRTIKDFDKLLAPIRQKEAKRVADGKTFTDKVKLLRTKYDGLTAALRAAKLERCQQAGVGGSAEQAAHALSVCYDQADAEIAGIIGEKAPKPNWSAEPNNARQKALDDCHKGVGPCPRLSPSDLRLPPPPAPTSSN